MSLRVSLGQTFLAFYYSFYGGVEPAENKNHESMNVSFSNSFRKYQFGICNKESSITEIMEYPNPEEWEILDGWYIASVHLYHDIFITSRERMLSLREVLKFPSGIPSLFW